MAVLRSVSLGPLGAFGQNTEASQIDLPPQYAARAENVFLDSSGRLRARYAFIRRTADNADLTTSAPVTRVYRHTKADGTAVLVCSGNNKLFRSDGSTLTQIGTGYTGNRWQFATLNGKLFAAQIGHSLRWFNETTWAETTIATPSNPRAVLSAYGRLWALSADGWTLHWSDLLDGTNFSTGASGSLDLSKMHTRVRSPAVAVAAHARFIVVLCEDMVIMLGLAPDLNPNNTSQPIYLADHVAGIGCVSRDAVVGAADDLLFLSPSGLRSLRRSLMEREGPPELMDASAANATLLRTFIAAHAPEDITLAWYSAERWAQLILPGNAQVWNFDFGNTIKETGLPVTTVWVMPASGAVHHGAEMNGKLWYGVTAGLADNTEYSTTVTSTLVVETGWLSLQAADQLKHLKRIVLNLFGGSGQTAILKWYVDFNEGAYNSLTFTLAYSSEPAEYGIGEYNIGEYSSGQSTADNFLYAGRSFRFVKLRFECQISGAPLVINNAQVQFSMGRIR